MKKIAVIALVFVFMMVIIPVALGSMYADDMASGTSEQDFMVTVYRSETSEYEEVELERYLIGVVAAEMPALFDMEALRAQAIAARTYVIRILENRDYILDTIMHQAFLDEDQLRERWGDNFDRHFAVVEEAVTSTRGLVLEYDGSLITPMFFAMSSGATENSEDVFSSARPYLRSVASLGYEDHDNFAVETRLSVDQLRTIFEDDTITRNNIEIRELSEGGNVLEVSIGSNTYTGREVRETLGLRSAAFSIETSRRGVTITTYGNGHGVGMSQHGANIMAQNGYNYVEILQHFYQGVELVEKNITDYE